MNTIGSRLKLYAKLRCGSMKRLAEEIGWTPDNLGKYSAGRNEPGMKLLRKLVEHGCNATWLISGEGSMLVEDLKGERLTANDQEMLAVLKTAGIRNAERLRTLLSELRKVVTAQESLKRSLGDLDREQVVRKRKKSGK